MSMHENKTLRERALVLLGDNIQQEIVANACGVTSGVISQLLADEEFAAEVAKLKYENLASHNHRDRRYEKLEDKLLDSLEKTACMLFDPMKITAVLTKINGMTRRGATAPAAMQVAGTVVNLTMPSRVVNNLTVNINNQVVNIGEKSLVTMQKQSLDQIMAARNAERELQGELRTISPAELTNNNSIAALIGMPTNDEDNVLNGGSYDGARHSSEGSNTRSGQAVA